jgi:hypothetical protein
MTLKSYLDLEHQTARTLADAAPFFKLLFPVLTVVGAILFFRYGWLGIMRRRTRLLGRDIYGKLMGDAVTGWPAVLIGIGQLMMGLICLALLGPISAAMWGLW